MSARSVLHAATVVAVVLGAGLTVAASKPSAGGEYPGNPRAEATLVATESGRIDQLRSLAEQSSWIGPRAQRAVVVRADGRRTAILQPSKEPYTLDSLQRLLPGGLVRTAAGDYLLTLTLAVVSGATLQIQAETPTRLDLESSRSGFVSIVSFGGTITLSGTPETDLRVTSRDARTSRPDTATDDGRAYLRAIGGSFTARDVTFDHLGFWSGSTGGVALTGTRADRSAKAAGAAAVLERVTLRQNAYGLFANAASQIRVTDSTVKDNLVHGIDFHRYVSDSIVRSSTIEDNAGDGIAIDRGSSGIRIEQSAVLRNGRDGISIDGSPLATGPSATGSSVVPSGTTAVADSRIEGNARDGVHLRSGKALHIHDNRISGSGDGIVVSDGATDVTVSGNDILDTSEHAIEVSGSRGGILVVGNTLSRTDTGVYLRDAAARVTGNTISHATRHGITAVGSMSGTWVGANTIAGEGVSPVDTRRSTGRMPVVAGNTTADWAVVTPADVGLRRVFQPMTTMWAVLAIAVGLTALGHRRSRSQGIRDPFAYLTPLQELGGGIVPPPEPVRGEQDPRRAERADARS